MKQIPLTKGQFAIVDDDKYEWLNQWKWQADKVPYGTYRAVRTDFTSGKKRKIYMHRQILGTPVGTEVDHKNHNTLDNRIQNIRNCTHAQNKQNSKPLKNKSSKYKGVHLYKPNGKWEVQIHFGKLINLGYFDNEIEAAKTYDTAARKYFGEFAYCNF